MPNPASIASKTTFNRFLTVVWAKDDRKNLAMALVIFEILGSTVVIWDEFCQAHTCSGIARPNLKPSSHFQGLHSRRNFSLYLVAFAVGGSCQQTCSVILVVDKATIVEEAIPHVNEIIFSNFKHEREYRLLSSPSQCPGEQSMYPPLTSYPMEKFPHMTRQTLVLHRRVVEPTLVAMT